MFPKSPIPDEVEFVFKMQQEERILARSGPWFRQKGILSRCLLCSPRDDKKGGAGIFAHGKAVRREENRVMVISNRISGAHGEFVLDQGDVRGRGKAEEGVRDGEYLRLYPRQSHYGAAQELKKEICNIVSSDVTGHAPLHVEQRLRGGRARR